MTNLWLLVLMLGVSTAQASTITQKTEGWCSPAVGHTQGNVTIVCQGVDPKALQRLNKLLDKQELELQEKIREAEEWTRKYQELSQRLAEEGKDNELARQAEALLKEGKLEEAGALLDRLIASDEAVVERVASNHFKRAQMFALQFKPLEALPHYERAYRYRPNNPAYAHAYAFALQKQNRFADAESIYQANLKMVREFAKADPPAYLTYVAVTLNNLANLYRRTQRFKEAEDAYQEALTISRQLAKADPSAYLPTLANIFNNLAILYNMTQRLKEAEDAYQGALTIYHQLAKADPPAYLTYVAETLNNLGLLYNGTQRFKQAEGTYKEALTISRQLAEANPPAYLPTLAKIFHNLALMALTRGDIMPAHKWIVEALTINRNLWQNNPAAYGDILAQNLGIQSMILQQTRADTATICDLLQKALTVAYNDMLKREIQKKIKDFCSQ